MQTADHGQGIDAGDELGELDGGDDDDEIVVEANNTRQATRPQGEWLSSVMQISHYVFVANY